MATRALFPTLLQEADLTVNPAWSALNADLKAAVLMLSEEDEAGLAWSERHRYLGYTSYASLNDLAKRATAFSILKHLLDDLAQQFAGELHYELGNAKLEMDSYWVNVLEPGGAHSGHIHPNSVLSGTYYVTVPDGAGDIRFEDPRLPLMMNTPQLSLQAPADQRRFQYLPPRPGLALFWESWLRHEVLPNLAETERISISFNYSVV